MPSWYHGNYGLCFGERYIFDPEYRVRTEMERQRLLYDRFGDLGVGSPDPQPTPTLPTVNGALPALFGAELTFSDDKFPIDEAANLSEDECWALSVPDLEDSYPTREFLQQAEYLATRYGRPPNPYTTMGPLNTAIKVRGTQVLADIIVNPDLAHHVFNVMCNTKLRAISEFFDRFNYLDYYPDYLPATSNCTVWLISPGMYEEVLLGYDRRMRHFFADRFGLDGFSIHHCGRVDEYVDVYGRLPVSSLHVGYRSDVKHVRATLPEIRFGRLLDPSWLKRAGSSEVYDEARRLMEEGYPLDRFYLDAADVEYGTPDDNIRALFAAANGQPW